MEQQTATSEILGVIASSPTDVEPVLDAITESDARVCAGEDATIRLVDGNVMRLGAHIGVIATTGGNELPVIINRDFPMGRAVLEKRTVHVPDLGSVLESEFPGSKAAQQSSGARTVLAAPLVREGVAIGVLWIRRNEVRPFTEKQIKLLETFADQAVIAIENVRLWPAIKLRSTQTCLGRKVGRLSMKAGQEIMEDAGWQSSASNGMTSCKGRS